MSPDSRTQSRNRTVVAAVILLGATFLCGMLAGSVLDRFVLFRQHRLLPTHGMRFVSERVVRRLDRELDLSDEQREKVAEILRQREQAIETTWNGIQPKVRIELDEANREIESVLTPEQTKKYRKLRSDWQRRARRVFGEENTPARKSP